MKVHLYIADGYSGPDYCAVRSLGEGKWEVKTKSGKLIGTYSSEEKAKTVAGIEEKRLMKEHLK